MFPCCRSANIYSSFAHQNGFHCNTKKKQRLYKYCASGKETSCSDRIFASQSGKGKTGCSFTPLTCQRIHTYEKHNEYSHKNINYDILLTMKNL